jgi:3-phosphoshikimate 1-carboxyvinyltransferase
MTPVVVRPGPVSGTVLAPSSKSYTHRALIAARLADRGYVVERPLVADDTLRTVEGLRTLGSRVTLEKRRWSVEPEESKSSRSRAEIDCGESGTTLRLLTAIAAATRTPTRFSGRGRLPHRPMGPLLSALGSLGAEVHAPPGGKALPFGIRGPIRGGNVSLDASMSSQFASALLFVLPTLFAPSTLRLLGAVVSAPYIEATIAVLNQHRVRLLRRRAGFSVPGDQTYQGTHFRVPGDASSAAYLWAAAAIAGGRVTVRGIPASWPQADLAVLDLLRDYGAEVQQVGDEVTVTGSARRPICATLTSSPDLYPLAGVLAATAPGESEIRGAPQAVLKESDRRAATARLARCLGATARIRGGSLVVRGTRRPRGRAYRGLRDHRLVMSAAVAALAGDRPSMFTEERAVEKSYPRFWEALEALGGGIRRP